MKTNLMKSILHLKDDAEYQIPLRETEKDNRAEVGANEENEADVETAATQLQGEQKSKKGHLEDNPTAKKKPNEISQEEVTDEEDATATQSQDDIDATEVYEEDPDETQTQKPSNAENSSNTTTESVPPADSVKAALDKMKKLASQKGVIHPSLFISNFSKILGLMERAMQLQVKESGSATEESGSVTKEAPKATEEKASETTEQTETPAEGKQGELNGNTNNNRS